MAKIISVDTETMDICETQAKKIAIVGLPNTGKSQVFNNLTGEYTIVANYPGTTIEMKRAKKRINNQDYEIIDTPGLHCLSIHSEEEVVVRNMILEEHPDVIIQCIDAFRINQSLILTADLLELELPICIAVNAIDEAAHKGIRVDLEELAQFLGVPVVELDAICGKGCEKLKDAIANAHKSSASLNYGYKLESTVTELAALMPFELEFKYKIAFLLLLKDPYIEEYLTKKFGEKTARPLLNEANTFRRRFKNNVQSLISKSRSIWADKAASTVVKKQNMISNEFSQNFAKACRHPAMGIPIFLFAMAALYISVVYASVFLETNINSFLVRPALKAIESLVLPVFWNDLLIGKHGLLTIGVFNALCTVLPILSVFFFIFGFFEDSGYMANFCVFSKKIFEKIGVSGKAITSLILGFACKTTATLNTRSLTSYKEKFITVFLIAFAIPCSAQISLSMVILAKVGVTACLIAFGTLVLFEAGAGLALNASIKQDKDVSFIQDIPAMRFPNLKAVIVKTYHRVIWFFQESMPVFIIAAAALFIFDKTGLLNMIKRALDPVIGSWMGLPSDIVEVFMLAFASRAAAGGLILNMINSGNLNYIQSIIAVVVTTTFFPCFPNVVAIVKRMGIMTAAIMSGMVFISSLVLAGALHWILVLIIK